jgi:hypothetical protein
MLDVSYTACCKKDEINLIELNLQKQVLCSWEGHEIPFVWIKGIAKFLANGLCKCDIYESVKMPLLCLFTTTNHSLRPSVCMYVATCEPLNGFKKNDNLRYYERFSDHFNLHSCVTI